MKKWWQNGRRLCGKGRFEHTPGLGDAASAVGKLYDIEKRVEITEDKKDERLAHAAESLDGKEITYCLGPRDCRVIEDCVLQQEMDAKLFDALMEAIGESEKK